MTTPDITSPQNERLRAVRKLQAGKYRARTGAFVAEGEDLIQAALAAGWVPVDLFVTEQAVGELGSHPAATVVAGAALDSVSSLGSGTRAIGVFEQRFAKPSGKLSVYLDAVADPGNIGTIIRTALALADGPVILGPGCADPFGPKAVRASMGAVFSRPPATATVGTDSIGTAGAFLIGLDAHVGQPISSIVDQLDSDRPIVLCLGAERSGLSDSVRDACAVIAHIPTLPGGAESLNVAAAAAIGLYLLSGKASSGENMEAVDA